MNLKQFNSPDPLFRPAPFWSWNDKLDKEELKRQIREMAAKGWGSYFMHSRVGLVTGYLSSEWMELVRTCAEEAKVSNTYAWLYDEDKWPSGFAGGEVPAAEAYRSRALVLLKKEEITENDTVIQEFEENNIKYYICKRISPMGNVWFNGTSYVDLMNPEAVKSFINCTHERYKETCGEYFGKEIPGIFTDEPCYLMESHYDIPVLPWSDYLPAFFSDLKEYDITEHVIELFFDVNDYRKVRYDFFDTATKLFLVSFTKQYYDWCEDNNLIMTGHFMAEDSLTYQLQWIGAAMPHYEFMHWPGIDKLGRNTEQLVTVKQVTSAADQLAKERSFCEVFGCAGQQVSFYHRKWIADWQAALGINFVNHHLSLYSMRGERKRDYPANLFYQQPWWDEEKEFSDYVGRLCYAVSNGKREVDVLIIHPIASVWSEYSPLHKKNNLAIENEIYDKPFEQLSKSLIANKLDFHYGDEMIMEKHAKVENGKLVIGQHAYSTVIVPPSLTLRSNTVKLLKTYAEEAGPEKLILMSPAPARIDGIESKIEWPDGIKSVDTVNETTAILDRHYPDRIAIIDNMTGVNADKIICHTRTSNDGRWIFIANTDEQREIYATISICGEEKPIIMDLNSGKAFNAPANITGGCVNLDVKFYPAGSLLLFYPTSKVDTLDVPPVLDSGVEFQTSYNHLLTIYDWQVNLLEQNVLPVNDVTLYLNGKEVLKNQPVSKAWHDYFYKAHDGTPFKAEYSFNVSNIPKGEVFAAIETAENLDKITINGIETTALKKKGELGALDTEKSWKDINFTRVPLTGLLCEGKNTLVLEGKKINNITGPGSHIRVENFKAHMPTEVETIYIVGDFAVDNKNNIDFSINGNKPAPDTGNLTLSGYPFYAGKAELTASFEYKPDKEKVLLRLNNVEAAYVKLYINGQLAGLNYWEPYIYDITEHIKDGGNKIKIITSTTLFNLMGPNRVSGIKDMKFVGPRTFIDFNRHTEKYALMPFGIGSATLLK